MAEKENNQFGLIALVGIVAVVGIVGLVFSMSATPNTQYVPVQQDYGAADSVESGNVVGDARFYPCGTVTVRQSGIDTEKTVYCEDGGSRTLVR